MGMAFILNYSRIFLDMQKPQSKKITPLWCLAIYSNLSYLHKSVNKDSSFKVFQFHRNKKNIH